MHMNVTELEYISPSVANGCYMSLGYYPKNTTKIVFDYLDFPMQGRGHFAALLAATEPYFRFCAYIDRPAWVLCYKRNQQLISGFTISGKVEVGNFYIKVNNNIVYQTTPSEAFTSTVYLTLGADKPRGGDYLDDVNTKIGRFRIYENDTLVADFMPALDENNVAGLYNVTNDTFFYSSTSHPWAAGPIASSIKISPNAKSISAEGGQFPINVSTPNNWVANPSDGSWYTVSPTGGTGSAVVTITVPSYSGNIKRTDTIDFTDTDTTDEVTFALTQRKYSLGVPLHLGDDEVTEIYLGDDIVSEAYLGEDLVFAEGAFVGLMTIPSTVIFNPDLLSRTVKVKASEPWSMTLPAWITASQTTGNTGETILTLTATAQAAATIDTITIVSADFSLSVTAEFQI